jgi:hypothetical protein
MQTTVRRIRKASVTEVVYLLHVEIVVKGLGRNPFVALPIEVCHPASVEPVPHIPVDATVSVVYNADDAGDDGQEPAPPPCACVHAAHSLSTRAGGRVKIHRAAVPDARRGTPAGAAATVRAGRSCLCQPAAAPPALCAAGGCRRACWPLADGKPEGP